MATFLYSIACCHLISLFVSVLVLFVHDLVSEQSAIALNAKASHHHHLIPLQRVGHDLLLCIAQVSEQQQFLVRASFLEIYNEEVRDLLSKNPKNKLELKERKDQGVYVKGLNSFVVKSVAEITSVLEVSRYPLSTCHSLPACLYFNVPIDWQSACAPVCQGWQSVRIVSVCLWDGLSVCLCMCL